MRFLAIFPLVIVLALGCGNRGAEDTSIDSLSSSSEAAPAAQAPAGRDLATLDLCELVPGESVAEVLAARLNRSPTSNVSDVMSECWYSVSKKGSDAGLDSYTLWVSPPGDYGMSKELEAGPLEEISGLGDEAYITHSELEDQYSLQVLIADELTLGAYGSDRERVLALARLALDRLPR